MGPIGTTGGLDSVPRQAAETQPRAGFRASSRYGIEGGGKRAGHGLPVLKLRVSAGGAGCLAT